MWRRWRESPAHDIAVAVLLTAVMLAGAYGEAHPTNPADKVNSGHPVPYTPTAAFLLVIVAGPGRFWRRRFSPSPLPPPPPPRGLFHPPGLPHAAPPPP